MSQLVLQLDDDFMHNYRVAFEFGDGEKPLLNKVLNNIMELEVIRMARNPAKSISSFIELKPKLSKLGVTSNIRVNDLLLNALYRAVKDSNNWKELTKANYASVIAFNLIRNGLKNIAVYAGMKREVLLGCIGYSEEDSMLGGRYKNYIKACPILINNCPEPDADTKFVKHVLEYLGKNSDKTCMEINKSAGLTALNEAILKDMGLYFKKNFILHMEDTPSKFKVHCATFGVLYDYFMSKPESKFADLQADVYNDCYKKISKLLKEELKGTNSIDLATFDSKRKKILTYMAVCKMYVDGLGETGKQLSYTEIGALLNNNYQELMRCTQQCLVGVEGNKKQNTSEFVMEMEKNYNYLNSKDWKGKKWLLILASQYVFWSYNESVDRGPSLEKLESWLNSFNISKTFDSQVIKSLTYKLLYSANEYTARLGVFSLDKLCQMESDKLIFDTTEREIDG